MFMSVFLSPLVTPVLPYWLRLRYKLYMFFARLRKKLIVEKYKRLALEKKRLKESWTKIDQDTKI
jgi:hypothetical protein